MTDGTFETKLAAAGETFEKIAKEAGLNVADFTEAEVNDILTTIMDGSDKVAQTAPQGAPAGGAPAAAPAGAAPAKVAADAAAPKFTYGEVMAEVMKFASANEIDLSKASPAELDGAVQKMAEFMANPELQAKQAALQEKYAEAEAMGRVMAHAYVDELGKIASASKPAKVAGEDESEKDKDEKEKAEKKAAFVRAFKTAGEMPEAFKKHLKGGDKGDEDGKGKDEDDKDKKEKEAFAKQASLLAAEKLILSGFNPTTGVKFASEAERIEAGANLILAQKGYA